MEAMIHINIPSGHDGSVITSGYEVYYGNNQFISGHWMFTTIKTPFVFLTQGLDEPHLVSGHRKFYNTPTKLDHYLS